MPGLYLPGSKPFGYAAKNAPAPVPAGSPGSTPPGYKPPWKPSAVVPPTMLFPPPAQAVAASDQPKPYIIPTKSYSPVVTPADTLARVVPALLEPADCPLSLPNGGAVFGSIEPVCEYKTGFVRDVIVHLNDSHRWSREVIAMWLETLPYDLTIQPASEGN